MNPDPTQIKNRGLNLCESVFIRGPVVFVCERSGGLAVRLASTHELHDFQLRPGAQHGFRPVRLFEDMAVQFHRNPCRIQLQLL
jgi:hypothetical protein